jgi:hypothetical protein
MTRNTESGEEEGRVEKGKQREKGEIVIRLAAMDVKGISLMLAAALRSLSNSMVWRQEREPVSRDITC